jgi:transcriptional regulator with XRE-family HTH domain
VTRGDAAGCCGSCAREPQHDRGEAVPARRERRRELGIPDAAEQVTLARTFGAELRRARGTLTRVQLASAAGLHRVNVWRLEEGRMRPTTRTCWALARALRDEPVGRVALFDRLCQCAGESLRDYGRRAYIARERVRERLRAEQGDGPLIGPGDNLGNAIAANLAELARASRRCSSPQAPYT